MTGRTLYITLKVFTVTPLKQFYVVDSIVISLTEAFDWKAKLFTLLDNLHLKHTNNGVDMGNGTVHTCEIVDVHFSTPDEWSIEDLEREFGHYDLPFPKVGQVVVYKRKYSPKKGQHFVALSQLKTSGENP